MTEYCSFCGQNNPPYHNHHIAGFINHPLWTTRICEGDCHLIANAWQYARRTPRNKEHVPPDSVKYQAIHEGLTAAYSIASEYAGESPASIAAGTIITTILKHDPEPLKGKDYSLDGNYPKLKAKQPVYVRKGMIGINFQRVLAAMCDMMAFIAEESEQTSNLARLLRQISERIPFHWPAGVPKADFLIALGTADEQIIKEKLSKFAAEIGVQL